MSIQAMEKRQAKDRGERGGLLDDYWSRAALAEELEVHPRTIRRYTEEPNGLPFVMIGGRVYHPKTLTREWLARRVCHPNPTRS